jgi:Kef-type K+ transport system membrane component KefB
MEHTHGPSSLLLLPVLLLAVAVISVPLARQLRLSAIVAYLAAGVVIGPYGFAPMPGMVWSRCFNNPRMKSPIK